MAYLLETLGESERLEKQARLEAYSLDRELAALQLSDAERVLDAGCGSGILARHLASRFQHARIEGCDLSAVRVQQAQSLSMESGIPGIRFFESPLEEIEAPDQSYDVLICRYVMEHLAEPLRVAREFFRVLRAGGRVLLIDFDGILFNLQHSNERLTGYLETLRRGMGADLFVGRKLPGILIAAGFQFVEWRVEAVPFSGAALEAERDLTRDRLAFSFSHLSSVLGSDGAASDFVDLYLSEMTRPGNTLFYNKFIVNGRR